jgi:DNA-directed RNA polymerase subunit M/transcription elongation factor TFIIS
MIEKGIYNYSIEKCNARQVIPIWENPEFVDIYISKAKNIFANLNNKCYVGNIKLIDKIKSGDIKPYDLAFIDTYKLFIERWNDIIEEKLKKEKMIRESLQECASDLFECPRCHKRKTIYCEVQTRSSDEPMTKFITCIECGKKWKKY